jgi:putative IMPACT (imprinted ancient) family translation regulator
MSKKRGHSPDPADASLSSRGAHDYFKSSLIEDRDSTFVGVFSPTMSTKELQKLPDFKSATHRMAAWRKTSTQRTLVVGARSTGNPIYVTGSDDDGEKYGGKRIEKVLNELKVEGTAVVVRWYGGVLLGPVRFTHIENVAREAVQAWKDSTEVTSKKQKLEAPHTEYPEEKERLVKDLIKRDQSIVVLRQLLGEKSQTRKQSEVASNAEPNAPTSSPSTTLNYPSMPVQRLRQLDKARDATIAWILKQIDAAETEANRDAD